MMKGMNSNCFFNSGNRRAGTGKAVAALVVAAVILLSTAARATAVKVEKDIQFGMGGEHKLLGDMYVPEGDGPFPAILFIHGGGFVGGDKAWKGHPEFITRFAERGYTVFSINYRLAKDGVMFPDTILDAKCGLAWFRQNMAAYKGDSKRVAVMGLSAGSYFASMLTFTQNDPEFQPVCDGLQKSDTSVDAAVLYFGPTNFNTIKSIISSTLENEMKRLARLKTKKELIDYKTKYSPINYIKSPLPPIFIGFSAKDQLVSSSQQWELMAALDKIGAAYSYYEAKGDHLDHGFIMPPEPTPESEESLSLTFKFLDKYLADSKK